MVRSTIDIVLNPVTDAEIVGVKALKRWTRFIAFAGLRFDLRQVTESSNALHCFTSWLATTNLVPGVNSYKDAERFTVMALGMTTSNEFRKVFSKINRDKLRAAGFCSIFMPKDGSLQKGMSIAEYKQKRGIPVYPSVKPENTTTLPEKTPVAVQPASPAPTSKPVVRPAIKITEVENANGERLFTRKSMSKFTCKLGHDCHTWKGISIPEGKAVRTAGRINLKNWYVVYDSTGKNEPLMYPGDPNQGGKANTRTTGCSNAYYHAVRHKYAEEAGIAVLQAKVVTLKYWKSCGGKTRKFVIAKQA